MGLLDKILNNIPEENTNPESVAHQGLLRKALGSISNEKDVFCDKDAHTKPEKDEVSAFPTRSKSTKQDKPKAEHSEEVSAFPTRSSALFEAVCGV